MIQSIKDLEKLLKLLRKQGVSTFKQGDLELQFGELPIQHSEPSYSEEQIDEDPYASFPDGILSPQQLEFYASGGRPEDDPFRTKGS